MKLSSYGKFECIVTVALALALTGLFVWLQWWWAIPLVILPALAVLAFFRDPDRRVPARRNVMVAPADGVVSSVHEVDEYDLFGEPATCVRIFLSLLDVHVTRSPCHGMVGPISSKKGQYLNAMRPESAEVNTWVRFALLHPVKKTPICAVRQVAGMVARNIVCGVGEGDTLQRGDRFGMMKFGSTAEVIVPKSWQPKVLVEKGQKVIGGETVVMEVTPPTRDEQQAEQAEATATAQAAAR